MILLLIKLALFLLKAIASILGLLFFTGGLRLLLSQSARYSNPLHSADGLKKGDILLTGKQSIGHSLHIQLANILTRKPKHRFWTHAAIYQGNGKVWEAQPSGIREANLSDYFNEGYYVRAFRHRYIKDEAVIDKIISFCADRKGPGYDLLGAIFFGVSILIPVGFNFIFDNQSIDRLFHVENTYFCSELIVDAFCEAGHPVSSFDGWRVKPTDFISNPVLDEIPASSLSAPHE